MSNASAQPHGVMEGKGSYNKHAKLRRAVLLWLCRFWKRQYKAWSSTRENNTSSSPIMDRHKGKTRWSRCRLRSEDCAAASALIDLFCDHFALHIVSNLRVFVRHALPRVTKPELSQIIWNMALS